MISIETWAYIRRLFFHEGMTLSAIAEELELDRKTVRKALNSDDFLTKKQEKRSRRSKLDPFKGAIANIIAKTPKLSGVRILEKLKDLGYTGGRSILGEYLATLPERKGEVYLRIETDPGGQAQCDWGKCGSVQVGDGTRHLSCFVMVLSWSRFLYVHFYLSETMECFLDGHLRAFRAFDAIPNTIVYDNLKSVVRQRYGKTILFNPKFMAFAGYHMFKPDPCRPRMPHHKGKAERGVGYTKNNFLGPAASICSKSRLNSPNSIMNVPNGSEKKTNACTPQPGDNPQSFSKPNGLTCCPYRSIPTTSPCHNLRTPTTRPLSTSTATSTVCPPNMAACR
jgi:transposase